MLKIDVNNGIQGNMFLSAQGNFQDAYHNITTKMLFGLKWLKDYCPASKFVLKLYDDVFLNTYKILELLQKEGEILQTHPIITCPRVSNKHVHEKRWGRRGGD